MTPPPKPKKQRGVQSLETGGAILRALMSCGGEAKLSDLAEVVAISAPQIHPYLVSLRAIGMVEQTPQGLYQIGPMALDLGLVRLQRLDAYQLALDHLPEVTTRLGMMAVLSVWGDHGPTIIYLKEGRVSLHAMMRLGNTFAMNSTATGRLFSAFDDSDAVQSFAKSEAEAHHKHLTQLGMTPEWLADRAAQIRAQGFELTEGIPIPGINAVTAPIFDHLGQIKLALTVVGAHHQLHLDQTETTLFVRDWARKISGLMGHATP